MKTIEQAAAMHREISRNAPHPGGLSQSISTLSGWASNQEDQSMTFTSRVASGDVSDPEKRHAFMQGFGCIEVNITAKWGGCHHDGSPRTETEVTVHVLDRLSGGMAQRTWETNGAWHATKITDEEIIPLLRSLLGQESLDEIRAREDALLDATAKENAEFLKIFDLK